MFPQLDDTKTVFDELCDARRENAELREAIKHFMNCDFCDSKFICIEGQIHANRIGVTVTGAKAV